MGWVFPFCGWRSNNAWRWATPRQQGEKSECRKVFTSLIVLPQEKKNAMDRIAEVWYISSFRSRNVFQWRSALERRDYLGGKCLKTSLLRVQKSLTRRIPASIVATRTKPGALSFETKVTWYISERFPGPGVRAVTVHLVPFYCGALNKSLSFSMPWFPHLETKDFGLDHLQAWTAHRNLRTTYVPASQPDNTPNRLCFPIHGIEDIFYLKLPFHHLSTPYHLRSPRSALKFKEREDSL